MNIRDEIDLKEREYKKQFNRLPTELLIDAYFLAELAKELGYEEDEFLLDYSILETYKGYKIGLLEEDGSDIIRFI